MNEILGEGSPCNPEDIGLKSTFLGPQAENADGLLSLVTGVFERWFTWRENFHPEDGRAISLTDQKAKAFVARRELFREVLNRLAILFESEVPKFSPRYVGHMLSEISLPALTGHIVALLHNPNLISGESAPVGVKIEDEAIEALARMIGYAPGTHSGHFTSGGTIANFEALVRARARLAMWLAFAAYRAERSGEKGALVLDANMGWAAFESLRDEVSLTASAETVMERFSFIDANPFTLGVRLSSMFDKAFKGPVVLVPQNRHYSWKKGVSLLGLGAEALWPIALDRHGRLCVVDLEQNLERAEAEGRPVMMVVSVAGSTELGTFDPIELVDEVLVKYRERRGMHIWHHVDGAYGGFFCSLLGGPHPDANDSLIRAVKAIARADSVTLDPHKLGYVPYASGAILVRDEKDYFVQAMTAPYIQYAGRDRGP